MVSEQNSQLPVVKAAVGESFEIQLQSMQGSTGYGWYLTGLPEGVALLSTTSAPVHPEPMIGPVRQIFVFVGLREIKASLEFQMLAPWKPTEPADRKVYALLIGQVEDTLEAEMGAGQFVTRTSHMVHMSAVLPYGFPEDAVRHKGVVFPLYGYPPPDGRTAVNVIESAENCVLMYGVPQGIADREHCNLKYGFPVNLGEDAKDVVIAYGFPPGGGGGPVPARMRGVSGQVKEVDASQCVVKYGTPNGIATDPANCGLKYGFPVIKD